MANRFVTKYRISSNGNIITLCNPDESWSPRFKHSAIRDIENNLHSYFMLVQGKHINISIKEIGGNKQLVFDSEITLTDNLNGGINC